MVEVVVAGILGEVEETVAGEGEGIVEVGVVDRTRKE
jgi:hypothetical protein